MYITVIKNIYLYYFKFNKKCFSTDKIKSRNSTAFLRNHYSFYITYNKIRIFMKDDLSLS